MSESDSELEMVLRLSLEQSREQPAANQKSSEDLAPANGTALAGKGADAAQTGVVDALASEKHGRWFSFDDRKVWSWITFRGSGMRVCIGKDASCWESKI